MTKLANKIALVTGGSSGIGLATAEALVAEGARVFVTGRRQPELDAATKRLGPSAIGVRADSGVLGDLDALFARIRAEAGHLDVVFANAGGGEFMPLEAVTEAHYDATFDGNVKGVFFTVQKALPLLRPGASIILNGSIAGSKGIPAFSVYGATKAALRSFARSFTTELAPKGIRVNVVSPGPIGTPGLSGLVADEAGRQAFFQQLVSTVPLGRLGKPEEIARAVVWLASDDASFVTGTELFVDGGAGQV